MDAFIILYVVGSLVAAPVLAYHLLRTRRDLHLLRDELRARGVTAPGPDDARRSVEALAIEVERLAEGSGSSPRFSTRAEAVALPALDGHPAARAGA